MYDPSTGQTPGCHDSGPTDTGPDPAPGMGSPYGGEDACGEDEPEACGGVCPGGTSSTAFPGGGLQDQLASQAPGIYGSGCQLQVRSFLASDHYVEGDARVQCLVHVKSITIKLCNAHYIHMKWGPFDLGGCWKTLGKALRTCPPDEFSCPLGGNFQIGAKDTGDPTDWGIAASATITLMDGRRFTLFVISPISFSGYTNVVP